MSLDRSEILYQFRRNRGLLGIRSKIPLRDEYILSLLYTPGVAEPCRRIAEDPLSARDLTIKGNAVAILSDGSHRAVSHLGSNGLIPYLESQAVICRELAAVDAYPFPLASGSSDDFVEAAVNLEPGISVLALEYCAFPQVLEIRRRIEEQVAIPVLDLEGEVLASLLLSGIYSSARARGRGPEEMEICLYGVNAATLALLRLGRHSSFRRIWAVDPTGRHLDLDPGICREAPHGCRPDVVINTVDDFDWSWLAEGVRPTFFDLSLTDHPNDALIHHCHYWRRDPLRFHPALVFPGLFRGILDCRLERLPDALLECVARELASIPSEETGEVALFPDPLDLKVAPAVARVLARQAARVFPDLDLPQPEEVYQHTFERIYTRGQTYSGPIHLEKTRTRKSSASLAQESLELHEQFQGAVEIVSKRPLRDEYVLRVLSPPWLEVPAREILDDPLKVFEYSSKSNLVGIVTDGSAVLGLGNIGALAGLPVMEGKCLLLKALGGVEALPICLASQDPESIIRTVAALQPILGGINLEDISAPRCFQIERRLRDIADIPVFHDDQHGTAVVVLAGILNSARCLGIRIEDLTVVISGAGAAAIAVSRLLLRLGIPEIILCDRHGAIYEGRSGLNEAKSEMARLTNRGHKRGDLAAVLPGARVFVGLSKPDLLTPQMVQSMHKDPLIFALANPTPEIMPEEAEAAGAAIVATGRSDFKNQINNSLAFPGIFRGALDVRARNINDEMKIAAARGIASLIPEDELRRDYIIPHALDPRVPPQVAAAVARAALETGQARMLVEPRVVRDNMREYLYGGRLDPVIGEPL